MRHPRGVRMISDLTVSIRGHLRAPPRWRTGARRLGLAAAVALAVSGCGPGEETKPDQPPAEVGGCFTIAGMPVGGCGEDFGYQGKFSGDEAAMRAQARKFDQTVWEGVLIGAVAGTAIGVLAGGDTKGAVGGAVIGASLGAIAGAYVARLQQRYASKEDQLNALIADLQTSNRESESLIAQVRTVIAEDRRRLAAAQARVTRGEATKADLLQERGHAWANRRVVEKASQGAQDQYRVFEGAITRFQQQNPGVKTGGFSQELNAYRAKLDTLDGLAASMGQA